jgi:hypothetical protein
MLGERIGTDLILYWSIHRGPSAQVAALTL